MLLREENWRIYSETSRRNRDEKWVQRFAEQAQSLLDAALAALERGESCTEMTVMTVLIGRQGEIPQRVENVLRQRFVIGLCGEQVDTHAVQRQPHGAPGGGLRAPSRSRPWWRRRA